MDEKQVEPLQELSPSEYFELVKDKKNNVTDEVLTQIYDNCLTLLNKYKMTGQTRAMRKLLFHLEMIEKEREIIKLGINTFVYRDDIEEFIEKVASDVVKIINLQDYEREIPDDIAFAVEKAKPHFNRFYVVFTDYTGKVEKQVTKERRDKDPILFATNQDVDTQTVIDRFYFIGDWEDEYCDLTLDKMVNQFEAKEKRNIAVNISTPKDLADLKEQLAALEPRERVFAMTNNKPKSFFKKVKSFLGRSK